MSKLLEAVTVCVNYSDFLAHTIILNRLFFNKYVVVTSYEDSETHRLCQYYNVTCIKTDAFYEHGDVFNKAKGINAGLRHLAKTGAVLHLDADIYLPPLFRTIFETLELDQQGIYGFDRFNCKGMEAWMKFLAHPELIYRDWVFQNNNVFPKVDRFMPYFDEGYIPIGFAQLWYPSVSGVFEYPEKHGYADRSDVLFAKQWPKRHRGFIPELLCIHLESDDARNGINWGGRKSKPFMYIENL